MHGRYAADCYGKVRFDSFTRAQEILRLRNRNGRKRHNPRKIYHCSWCGGFHLGGAFLKHKKEWHEAPDGQ